MPAAPASRRQQSDGGCNERVRCEQHQQRQLAGYAARKPRQRPVTANQQVGEAKRRVGCEVTKDVGVCAEVVADSEAKRDRAYDRGHKDDELTDAQAKASLCRKSKCGNWPFGGPAGGGFTRGTERTSTCPKRAGGFFSWRGFRRLGTVRHWTLSR